MANINRSFIFAEEAKVRGMLVPQRSESTVIEKNPMKSPFISMVTIRDPLGFNSLYKPVVIERKKNNNEVYNRNRKYIKLMQEKGVKKKGNEILISNPIYESGVKMNKTQSMKYLKPLNYIKHNKEEEIQEQNAKQPIINHLTSSKKVTKEEKVEKKEEKFQVVVEKGKNIDNNIKEKKEEIQDNKVIEEKNEEKVNIIPKESKIEQDNPLITESNIDEEEMNKIIGYIGNLDYEKYARDLEIREALQLIKNKMDQEKQNEDDDKQKHQPGIIEHNQSLKQDNEVIKEKEEEVKVEAKLPEIKSPIVNKQEEEKQEEIKKLQLAEQISKCAPV